MAPAIIQAEKSKQQKPIIVKKIMNINKNTFLRLKNISIPTDLIKEHEIYESKPGDFLKGDPQAKVVLYNQLNMVTNSSRTVAKYISVNDNKVILEKSSDCVTKIIGQKNYDTIFAALCSVISQELKVRGMLSLLTEKDIDKKPEIKEEKIINDEDMNSQSKFKSKRRRTKLTPYVVKDTDTSHLKRVTIDPNNIEDLKKIADEDIKIEITEKNTGLVEIVKPFDEDSNQSLGNISLLSGHTGISNILEKTDELLHIVDQRTTQEKNNKNLESQSYKESPALHINECYIELPDGSRIMVPVKPEDDFHIATPEILRNVTNEERRKLLWFQAYKDWKLCLERDEDGLLPLHNAVLNNDLDLIRRQCLVLRNRQESLDIVAGTQTALQMSIHQNSAKCAAMLLQYGADPFVTDEENRTAVHLAAEFSSDLLRAVIRYCQNNALHLLEERELWTPFMANKTKEQITSYLLDHICQMIDNQGYTALMLASKIGNHENVKQLVEASPSTINMSMPNCGNTALYQAVAAACLDAVDRGNRRKIAENFMKTIEVLVDHGADPAIDNHAGSNVNLLLTEFNIAELSMLIANKMTSLKFFNGNMPSGSKNFDSYMLVKDRTGKTNIEHIEKTVVKINEVVPKNIDKPRILENITITKTCVPNLKGFRKINPKEKLVDLNKKSSEICNSEQIGDLNKSTSYMQTIKTDKTTTVIYSENKNSSLKNNEPFLITASRNAAPKTNNPERVSQSNIFLSKFTNFVPQNGSGKKSNQIEQTFNNSNRIIRLQETEKKDDTTSENQKRKPAVVVGPTSKKQRLLKSLEK